MLSLDVIEHLRSPERFMERLAAEMAPHTKLVVSTGNVAFAVPRALLLAGGVECPLPAVADSGRPVGG
jgi:2-polyprenyl-3-methyl-5-hydroxy-6-metoxy-1,4-benzoquinol methylase